MSATAVFTGVFLLLIVITFVSPVLPPAQFVYDLLNISQPTISIWGVSAATLLISVTNGFFWGTVITVIYSLSRYFTRRKSLPPMPVASVLRSSKPKPGPMPLDYRADRYPPAFTVRKQRGRTEQEIETIEGIGSLRGRMLRGAGIGTVDDLLRAGATRMKRQRLANEFGVSYHTVHKWVCRGDLLRVRGIGRQYSELLEEAGVSTITDLSMRNPRYLWQKLKTVNRGRRLVGRVPPFKTVENWVYKAGFLEPIIE
jgi:predicted flap endonuclease-1-like 5' DNA nuclease